jgi:hypothetical protein
MDTGRLLPDNSRVISGYHGSEELGGGPMSGTLPADEELLAAASAVAASVDLPSWPGRDTRPVVHTGVIGSSDRW